MKRAAFYVWTQTQLVNAVIVRRAFFSDIPADLYVLDVGRISTNSLLFLKQRKIFDELVFFTLPPYCPTKLMLSKLPLLKLMIHSLEYKRFFLNFFWIRVRIICFLHQVFGPRHFTFYMGSLKRFSQVFTLSRKALPLMHVVASVVELILIGKTFLKNIYALDDLL